MTDLRLLFQPTEMPFLAELSINKGPINKGMDYKNMFLMSCFCDQYVI